MMLHRIIMYNIHLYYNIWARFSPLCLTAVEALSVKISCVGTAPLSDAIDRLIVFSHRRGTHTHAHTFEIYYNTKIIIFYRAHDLFDASFSTITYTDRECTHRTIQRLPSADDMYTHRYTKNIYICV